MISAYADYVVVGLDEDVKRWVLDTYKSYMYVGIAHVENGTQKHMQFGLLFKKQRTDEIDALLELLHEDLAKEGKDEAPKDVSYAALQRLAKSLMGIREDWSKPLIA